MSRISRSNTVVRLQSIVLVVVLVFDLISASLASASLYYPADVHAAESEALSSLSLPDDVSYAPTCHDMAFQADENISVVESETSSVKSFKMSCCPDDCSHCPAFLSFYQPPSTIFQLLTSIEVFEPSVDVPVVSGYIVSIYRPPAII